MAIDAGAFLKRVSAAEGFGRRCFDREHSNTTERSSRGCRRAIHSFAPPPVPRPPLPQVLCFEVNPPAAEFLKRRRQAKNPGLSRPLSKACSRCRAASAETRCFGFSLSVWALSAHIHTHAHTHRHVRTSLESREVNVLTGKTFSNEIEPAAPLPRIRGQDSVQARPFVYG